MKSKRLNWFALALVVGVCFIGTVSAGLYETLEIPHLSSAEAIRKAFKRLSIKHHPDKNKNNDESLKKFQDIANAYEILIKPDLKNLYDN